MRFAFPKCEKNAQNALFAKKKAKNAETMLTCAKNAERISAPCKMPENDKIGKNKVYYLNKAVFFKKIKRYVHFKTILNDDVASSV